MATFFGDLPTDVFRTIYGSLSSCDRLSLLLSCRSMRATAALAAQHSNESTAAERLPLPLLDDCYCCDAAITHKLKHIVAMALLEMRTADPLAACWLLNVTTRLPRAPSAEELQSAMPCDPFYSESSVSNHRFRLVQFKNKPPTAVKLPWFAQRPASPINDLYSPDDQYEVTCVDGAMTAAWTALCCCVPLVYLIPACIVDTRCFTADPLWHIRFAVVDAHHRGTAPNRV